MSGRGAAKIPAELGHDVRSVLDLAAKNAVKQQMHLSQSPTIRRSMNAVPKGKSEDGQ